MLKLCIDRGIFLTQTSDAQNTPNFRRTVFGNTPNSRRTVFGNTPNFSAQFLETHQTSDAQFLETHQTSDAQFLETHQTSAHSFWKHTKLQRTDFGNTPNFRRTNTDAQTTTEYSSRQRIAMVHIRPTPPQSIAAAESSDDTFRASPVY
jgi:hypothetical protein